MKSRGDMSKLQQQSNNNRLDTVHQNNSEVSMK